jgi:hypothetical protein
MRTIFLSRATNEFGWKVNPLRQVAEREYQLLEVTDQLFPPSPNHRLEAKETVSRLREWLTKVDAVVHFVGQRAGAVCKVPEGDFDGILNFLNPPTRKLFEELAGFFEANGISRDAITYTHLEGVLAIAESKVLYVLRLSADTEDAVEPAQEVYRRWLEGKHLGGRDKCDGASIQVLVEAAHRKLAEWNEFSRMEQLARSSQEVPVWQTIFDVNQPGVPANDIETRWQQVLRYEADSSVDWIDRHQEADEPTTGFIHKSAAPEPNWLIPGGTGVYSLALGHGEWLMTRHTLPGNLRAVCHDGMEFCLLCEATDLGTHTLERLDQTFRLKVEGFQTHHFGALHLWHSSDVFHVVSGNRAWKMAAPTGGSPDGRVTAVPCDLPKEEEDADSGVLPQFPKTASFPFRRHFRGLTFEYGLDRAGAAADAAKPWALTLWRHKLHHLVFRAGDFTDAFKTVDVSLAGKWEMEQVVLESNIYWLRLNQGQTRRLVPLHQARAGMGRMVIQGELAGREHVPLLRRVAGMQLSAVFAVDDSQMRPFCFIAREATGDPVTETRLRVWLVPALPSAGILKHLGKLLCEMEALPTTPVTHVGDHPTLPPFGLDAGWWKLLWDECQIPAGSQTVTLAG